MGKDRQLKEALSDLFVPPAMAVTNNDAELQAIKSEIEALIQQIELIDPNQAINLRIALNTAKSTDLASLRHRVTNIVFAAQTTHIVNIVLNAEVAANFTEKQQGYINVLSQKIHDGNRHLYAETIIDSYNDRLGGILTEDEKTDLVKHAEKAMKTNQGMIDANAWNELPEKTRKKAAQVDIAVGNILNEAIKDPYYAAIKEDLIAMIQMGLGGSPDGQKIVQKILAKEKITLKEVSGLIGNRAQTTDQYIDVIRGNFSRAQLDILSNKSTAELLKEAFDILKNDPNKMIEMNKLQANINKNPSFFDKLSEVSKREVTLVHFASLSAIDSMLNEMQALGKEIQRIQGIALENRSDAEKRTLDFTDLVSSDTAPEKKAELLLKFRPTIAGGLDSKIAKEIATKGFKAFKNNPAVVNSAPGSEARKIGIETISKSITEQLQSFYNESSPDSKRLADKARSEGSSTVANFAAAFELARKGDIGGIFDGLARQLGGSTFLRMEIENALRSLNADQSLTYDFGGKDRKLNANEVIEALKDNKAIIHDAKGREQAFSAENITRLDQNGDGQLSTKEIKEALENSSLALARAKATLAFTDIIATQISNNTTYDANDDGKTDKKDAQLISLLLRKNGVISIDSVDSIVEIQAALAQIKQKAVTQQAH